MTLKNLCSLLIPIIFLLASCSSEQMEPFWEGSWKRTVKVPKNLSGRCYDETLLVEGKKWYLNAVLHATDACDTPYLELSYQGVLEEVHIKRNSADRKLLFQVEEIGLVAMSDIAGDKRQALPEGAVKALSGKYVPEENKEFEQVVEFDETKGEMRANYFIPLLLLAVPDIKKQKRLSVYRRQTHR